jgi:hypothetical protein
MPLQNSSLKNPLIILILLASALGLNACSLAKLPYNTESCKIQAYVDQVVPNYLSERFVRGNIPRIAVIPFEVPANFSPAMNPLLRLGHDMATGFQRHMLQTGEQMIVELFDRGQWPGKRMDFSTGNLVALEQARDAGYDFIFVGYLDDIKDDVILRVHTKLVDTENSSTVWYGTTDVMSRARPTRGLLDWMTRGYYPVRHDLFEFRERFDELEQCTVQRMFTIPSVEKPWYSID